MRDDPELQEIIAHAVDGSWEQSGGRHPYAQDIIEEYMNENFGKSLGRNITWE